MCVPLVGKLPNVGTLVNSKMSKSPNMSDQLAEFAQRLTAIINERGGMSAVAAGAEVPLSTLGRYVRGDSEPSAFRLAAIARFCGVTVEQLVYGLGAFPKMEAGFIGSAHKWESEPQTDPDVVMIPLLDVIASAGPGYENDRPFELSRLPFPRGWLQRMGLPEQHARFLGSRGDSMEPTIMDGAIVLVDTRSLHARTDGIYVLVDGPNVRIKRIAVGWQNSIVLISDNERYASETLAPPDAEALRVAGKVVWAGGEL